MNAVRTSIAQVVQNATHVTINSQAITQVAQYLGEETPRHWLTVSPFSFRQLSQEEKLSFLFVLNAISFSYWGKPKWEVDYKGKTYDGAQGMMAALGRAIEEGKDILHPEHLADMTKQELRHILRGNVDIPLLGNRARILRDVGRTVLHEYNGSFHDVVAADGDALTLVDTVVNAMPSFNDTATYAERIVRFNKRAQLLVADIHYGIGGNYCLQNVGALTACADYKLPQVFRRHGVFTYDTTLQQKIRTHEELARGSPEEVEIRAATIHAVDILTQLMKETQPSVTVSQVNDWLWLEGQKKVPCDEPYHRTRSIAY